MQIYFDDFTRELSRTSDLPAAKALLQRTIEQLGFVSFDYGHGVLKRPVPISPNDVELQLHLATFDWTSQYIERGYQHVDRATFTSLTRSTPWSYWDVLGREPENALQREMEAEVLKLVSSGLAIPVHGLGLSFGQMHLGSKLSRPEFDRLDREVRPIAVLVAAYFHEHVKSLLDAHVASPSLRERERECLLWASRGKTTWEISTILGYSERATRSYTSSAMAKLDVRTRAQAVARAIALGLIQP